MARRDNKQAHIPSRLAISAAVATALLTGYGGRKAYADCTQVVGQPAGTFTCSSATNATQSPSGTPLTVTTDSSFSIITTQGNALYLTGTYGLTFTDNNTSTITGKNNGIYAYNDSGKLSITTSGAVKGTRSSGIYAYNHYGTDMTIVTAAVTGYDYGIYALNNGTGDLTITSNAAVEGTRVDGINANNDGTNLTIDTKAAVTGNRNGILAYNLAQPNVLPGELSITSTGAVEGTTGYGIYARSDGTNLTIDTKAAVTGGEDAINAY
ncbi:MAG: hypothetical protein GY814_16070, partial [Gammaproteobacteria bacterium]|nr:hypothetical protein [Gammaproteobacteria bacterium]